MNWGLGSATASLCLESWVEKVLFLQVSVHFGKRWSFFIYQKLKQKNGEVFSKWNSLVFSAALRKYLLEKSRLVCQAPEERYVLDISYYYSAFILDDVGLILKIKIY